MEGRPFLGDFFVLHQAPHPCCCPLPSQQPTTVHIYRAQYRAVTRSSRGTANHLGA